MITRDDRLNDRATHEEYYAQFVTPEVREIVVRHFGLSELREAYAKDKNLNNLPLSHWDHLTYSLPWDVVENLRRIDGVASLCNGVCTLKEAAREMILSD
jgi:hypothetical protein